MKPTHAQLKLLRRLENGPKLKAMVDGSGRSRVPGDCLRAGFIEMADDDHVKDPWGFPAPAYRITDLGRSMIFRD